jgi:hypothetical protein
MRSAWLSTTLALAALLGGLNFALAQGDVPLIGDAMDAPSAATPLERRCADWTAEPAHGIIGLVGYDAWKGISDMGWQNNGIHAGFNYGTRLGALSDATGIGFQIGGTMGVFNWSGSDYRPSSLDQAQPQGFLTYGFFRKASEDSPWIAAFAQDWMLNDNYGVFAQNPTLSQWRGQLGYALDDRNDVGVWGAARLISDTRNVPGVGTVSWRPMNQLNFYSHHTWAFGADTWLWVGIPERGRFAGNGTLGDYMPGALANIPLNNRVGLYALVTYMHPSVRAGPRGFEEEAWNFTIGLSFYPRGNASSGSWLPQLPVANNGYFLVDTNGV